MNFPGPINANLASASAVSLDGEQFTFNSQSQSGAGHNGANGIVVPDKHLLFTGDYAREGNDLILSAPDQKYVVHDYFKGEQRSALVSEDGAMLSGHVVSSLTGHVQYAQATAPDAAQVIGHVMKLAGSASVIRNGVTVELNIGDAVQKGDVVQTGSDSSIAMTLIDGSAFGMTSNARMVLNEMVYDPNGSSNSSFISLVQGTVTFVAGQTAKNGNMRVETPVATMGIRGTAVGVKIYAETGVVEAVLGVEPDGHTGGFAYYDNTTGELLGTVTQSGRVTIISPGGIGQAATATEQQLSPQASLADKSLFNLVYQLAFPNFNPDDSKPKSTDHPRTDIGVPPTILGKIGTDHDSGRPTVTYVIPITNPDTHVTTNLTIVYVNTPPSFSVKNEQGAQAITTGLHHFKLGDDVTITDPDIGVAPFFDVAVPYAANSGALVQATGPSSIVFGTYLVNPNIITLDPVTGIVTYNPEGFRFLDLGETAVYKFTFGASSGVGSSGSDAATLTLLLTVTGQNDAPTIVPGSIVANGVTEDVSPVSGNIKTSGLITFQDFDLTDAHTVTFVPISTSISTSMPGFTAGTTSLGAFTITPAPENLTDTDDTGTVAWSFVLDDSDPVLQSLAEGQTITQTYKITITDSHGVPVDQIVTVTITGTNDGPVIGADTAPPHIANETLNATDANPLVVDTVSGSLTFSDVDLIDTHLASAHLDSGPLSVVWSGGAHSGIPQDTLDALVSAMTATIGTDSTSTGAGVVNWTFKLSDHLSDFLAHGETLTVVYDVTVTDNSNTATSQSQVRQVTVQVAAANDQPVITSYDTGTTVTEDLNPAVGNLLTDFGPVTFSDADLTDTHTAQVTYNSAVASGSAIVSSALATALNSALTVPAAALAAGANTFNWDFALDNSLVQYLGAGETITATYTIGVTDNSLASDASAVGQTVTVIITGSNDIPTINVTNALPDTEGNTGTSAPVTVAIVPHVSIADVDTDDLRTPYVAGTLAFDTANSTGPLPTSGPLSGLFTLNTTTGTISYDKADFDYLAAGDVVTAVFNFDASSGPDPQHKSITVTINGENDAPVPVADAITNDTPPSAVGWVLDTDNGHYYRYVADVGVNWTDAGLAAAADGGYLASITSASEQSFVSALLTSGQHYSWLGGYGPIATDTASWYWASGPEQGTHFTYTNWNAGEPNGFPGFTDAGLSINSDGTWNDIFTTDTARFVGYGYVEEWGGQAGQVVFREDTGTTLTTQQLLANDTDVDTPHASLSITGVSASSAYGGSVSLDGNIIAYHPAANYNGIDSFTYTLFDGSLTSTGTVSFNVDAVNDAPQLIGDGLSIVHGVQSSPDYGTITKVVDLALSDSDEGSALSTVSAVAGHGTVTYFDGSTDASLASGVSANVTDINAILHDGITYTPTLAPSTGAPGDTLANTDKVTVTVTDSHGASDTTNFIFQQDGAAPNATQLTGTTGKDLIFATQHDDALTGLASQDNFVFLSNTGVHTVTDFTQGQDRVDLHMSGAPTDNATLGVWLNLNATQSGADTILYLDAGHTAQNQIVLQHVTLNTLMANDFIIHA